MKKVLPPLLLLAITAFSFRTANFTIQSAVPLCDGLNAVIKEEPTGFAMLMGELKSEDNGSKSYQSKVTFDGWPSNEFVLDDDGSSSVDIMSELMTTAKAKELFNQTSKMITSCLKVQPEPLKAENKNLVDNVLIFTKDKVEVGLMLITNKEKKTLVLITISRA